MGQKLSRDHVYQGVPIAERFERQVTKLKEDHLLPSKVKRYKRGETFAERGPEGRVDLGELRWIWTCPQAC